MFRVISGMFVILVLVVLTSVTSFAQEELPPAPEVPPDPVSSSVLDGMLLMSNESMIMLVAGVVLSMVSTIVVKQAWSDDIKAGIYFLVCLGFGLLYTVTLDEWSTADLARRVMLVFVAGTLFYQTMKGPMQTLTIRTDNAMNRTE